MKQLVNYYAGPLTHMINQSILQGYFPEELKLAKVLLIYKSEDEQLVQNYRLMYYNFFQDYLIR